MTFRNNPTGGTKLILVRLQSENYVENVSGWAIERDGGAQFENLVVLQDLAAGAVAADTGAFGAIELDGKDLATILATIQDGSKLIEYGYQTDAANTIGDTEVPLVGLDVIIPANRMWRVVGTFTGNPDVETDEWYLRVRGVAGTSVPNTSSTEYVVSQFSGIGTYRAEELYANNGDAFTLRLILTVQRRAGTGLMRQTVNASYFKTAIRVYDDGPARPNAGWNSPGTATPPTPPTPQPKPFTYTFRPTWDASYRGDGTKRTDKPHLFHGYTNDSGGAINGNNRALVGFGADVQAALAGATITRATFVMRVLHTYQGSGMPFRIGTHSYTGEPGTWSGGPVTEGRVTTGTVKAGATVKVDLGSTIASELRSGAARGIAIGPAATNSEATYGYVAGLAESGAPYLIVEGAK